jgi:Protein of unknown function (DUF2892)
VTQVTDRADTVEQTSVTGVFAGPTHRSRTMKSNVGGIDRILRIVLGLALIGLTLMGTIGVWGWVGVVPLLTAAMGSCPLYTVLGFSSCPLNPAKKA